MQLMRAGLYISSLPSAVTANLQPTLRLCSASRSRIGTRRATWPAWTADQTDDAAAAPSHTSGAAMFLTYLRRELRRRARQAILIALGLAVGVGLVITVTAASAGVSKAQSDVLHSLYGVGTDITVTQPAAAGTGGVSGVGVRGPPAAAPPAPGPD